MSFIQVKWKREIFNLEYTESSLSATTLAQLKERCSELTGIPTASMKLLVTGVVMKDDTATLASYGLRMGSKIMLIGSKPEDIPPNPGSTEESQLISRIQQLLEKTHREIFPQLDEFELEVARFVSHQASHEIKERGKLQNLRNYLNEQLMQALFALDGVVSSSEFESVRDARRAAVKETQMALDRLDSIGAKLGDFKERM
ncbi:hypothetical protein K493DRAFT_234379 [Basidiobolus meristosporus CBS 931.73]|uniref:BAG domain-containing protein n=1 Tax=Basidiobolus meristosporus CBS 931.73 TaxID=1314790 RepID=A0A1Y1XTW1_9FUNG|nr:hypothetical protein K493DRAFT_234379 [Basidiobolus meristosporus CBS 931.73]|eukprot:ORX89178.1 hypothetical protein K493DRAFT_234379 [Basidiobolus meristosporus CBS 931.73]